MAFARARTGPVPLGGQDRPQLQTHRVGVGVIEWDRAHLDALPIPAALIGDGVVVAVNAAMAATGGLSAADPPAVAAAAALRAGVPAARMRWRRGDAVGGRHFDVHFSAAGAFMGAPACLMTLVDRTAEHEGVLSLRAEFARDSLTGLPNRTAFSEAVDERVGPGVAHAMLLVDLARFGRINQTLGSVTGDEVIITVARRLLSAMRAGDVLARIGADEFGFLIHVRDQPEKEATAAARRIRDALSAPFRLSDYEIGIDCAIGCAISNGIGEAGEGLVRRAQLALKRAKATGRFEVHAPRRFEHEHRAFDLETELRRAIERRQLSLAFQPIVALRDDRLIGFEALARWAHPDRGEIAPSEFIAVAEETGLIVPLGRWALETALATLAEWDVAAGEPLPITMSVNISAIQFLRDDVPALVAGALTEAGIGGSRLTVELTESAIVHDPDRITRAMLALKGLDARIAMDDFGTGYSSLAYLRRLPIDILKIDRSFVTGMLADRDKIAIVRAVLSLAEALGRATTAEGVETAELGRTLSALGCTAGQGFVYARPLPADEAYAFARARLG